MKQNIIVEVMFRIKFFVLFTLFICSNTYGLNPRGSLHLMTAPPATMDLNSFYLSSTYYSFSLSSYLPQAIQRFTSRWSVGIESSWAHRLSFLSDQKTDGKLKAFPSPKPLLLGIGVQWEIEYLPTPITPVLGISYVANNIFKAKELGSIIPSFSEKYFYLLRAGLFFSFDILNRYTSKKMQHEYDIQDIGLYVEYRKYIPVKNTSSSVDGWNFGMITFF